MRNIVHNYRLWLIEQFKSSLNIDINTQKDTEEIFIYDHNLELDSIPYRPWPYCASGQYERGTSAI